MLRNQLISPHDKELARITAKAVLFARKDKILLLRKPNGRWDLPGGRLEHGEDWIDGLTREVYEESGLRIEQADWLTGWTSVRPGNRHFLMGIFLCRIDCKPKKSRISISREHVEGRFFSLRKTQSLFLPPVYGHVIARAAGKIGVETGSALLPRKGLKGKDAGNRTQIPGSQYELGRTRL